MRRSFAAFKAGSRLSRVLLYDLKAKSKRMALVMRELCARRNPIVIHVLVAIALRVFDERCMDGVRDQFCYSIGQCCLLLISHAYQGTR